MCMQQSNCSQECEVNACRARLTKLKRKGQNVPAKAFADAVIAPMGLPMKTSLGEGIPDIFVWAHGQAGHIVPFRSGLIAWLHLF